MWFPFYFYQTAVIYLHHSSKLQELDLCLFWIGVGGATGLYKETLTPVFIDGQNGRVTLDISQAPKGAFGSSL